MTRDDILQALASAQTHKEQIALVAELDALDHGARKTAAAQRSLDWADTTVRQTLAPGRTLDRHTASSDWLGEVETAGGQNRHQAVIAEASLWFQRLDADVKADAGEFTEQAKGIARRTAGKYGESAEEAADAFMQYVAFLNRQVLAASGLPQVQQLVDAQENSAQTPLPTDVFDNFAPPIHPINQGVDGTQTNSLAEGAEEAMGQAGTGTGPGRPSVHEEGQDPVSQPYNMPPSARQGGRKQAGMLERARHQAAQLGHSMRFEAAEGQDAWSGRCTGCGSAMAVTATGIVEGSTAHVQSCNHRSLAGLAQPSVAIGYTMNLDDYLRTEAENKDLSGWAEAPDASGEPKAAAQSAEPDEGYNDWVRDKQRQAKAGGAAPFAREAERGGGEDPDQDEGNGHSDDGDKGEAPPAPSTPARHQGASGLDQVQQTMDSFENTKPTSLPTDVMFPIDQPWPETQTSQVLDQGGQDTGPTNRPRQASRKTADTWSGGDSPKAVPGGTDPIANSSATTPPRSNSGGFEQGVQQGRADAAQGDAPSFADNSSNVSDYVRGYVQGFGTGPQPTGPRDVPVSMGGDNGQAQNAAEIAARTEKPLTVATRMSVSASLITKDVSGDADFIRGYAYGRCWKQGEPLVAMGSSGEEAGIFAGITDNPAAQRAWVTAHRRHAAEHPELTKRLRQHKLVTANYAERNQDAVVKGLYVQSATSLDLDTMSPVTSPDPQGATPSEGPGTVPILRDAPGTPAAPGGASPYNGAEPYGAPVVPDPLIQDLDAAPPQPQSPDAVHMTGDSSMLSKNPSAVAFRKQVQANKLALRKKEN